MSRWLIASLRPAAETESPPSQTEGEGGANPAAKRCRRSGPNVSDNHEVSEDCALDDHECHENANQEPENDEDSDGDDEGLSRVVCHLISS